MNFIYSKVEKFGGSKNNVQLLDEFNPKNLAYSTILTAKKDGIEPLKLVSAVYEQQHQPLMYLIDGSNSIANTNLLKLRRMLAMRGDTPYMGIVAEKSFKVYNIALDEMNLNEVNMHTSAGLTDQKALFNYLWNNRPDSKINLPNWVSNVILRLLCESINNLIDIGDISSDFDAISLVGRALFTRFLIDRKILSVGNVCTCELEELFDNAENASHTSKWLDTRFNGDFLPLDDGIYATLTDASFAELRNILRKAPSGNLYLGWKEKWDHLDFAHIPVGILSQVYEMYLKSNYPEQQRRQGGYYTTPAIADFMVESSVRAVMRDCKNANMKILDPAVGAGVFLISAFRQLVKERWIIDGKRPETKEIRSILNNQIVGFDIDKSALRFTALGLYLMAIELDPYPKPERNLKFKNLNNRVLYLLREKNQSVTQSLGSLSKLVSDDHIGKYDIVIGNPPWSSRRKTKNWDQIEKSVNQIAVERGLRVLGKLIPNKALDLPFVWKSMKWAKPGGQIVFALHARLFFKQGYSTIEARHKLFEALDIKSLVNFSELRTTNLWPNHEAPFCILFAKNLIPKANIGFRLVTPRYEKKLNDAGGFRLDVQHSPIIGSTLYKQFPFILKTLSAGDHSDFSVIAHVHSLNFLKLGEVLGSATGGVGFKGKDLARKINFQNTIQNIKAVKGLPVVSISDLKRVQIDYENLKQFEPNKVSVMPNPKIFSGPILLVHESPSASQLRLNVSVGDQDLLYNSSVFGYSVKNIPNNKLFIRYLSLILKSNITIWQLLMTSGKFGIERDTFQKIELENLIIPKFSSLSTSQLSKVSSLFKKLVSDPDAIDEVDSWVAKLYQMEKFEQKIIADTLKFRLPFASVREFAENPATANEIKEFGHNLKDQLHQILTKRSLNVKVKWNKQYLFDPWICYDVQFKYKNLEKFENDEVRNLVDGEIVKYSNKINGSSFLLIVDENHILVGVLNQRRYFSLKKISQLVNEVMKSKLPILGD